MAVEQFANLASTQLTALLSQGGVSVSVANGSTLFPAQAQFRVRVEDAFAGSAVNVELMLVTAGAGSNTWTVTRGIEGTTAVAHAAGSAVTHVVTAAALGGQSDPAVDVPGLRTLGTGAQQAAPGTSAPTAAQQAALAGTGTPGGGNKFVTNDGLVSEASTRASGDSALDVRATALEARLTLAPDVLVPATVGSAQAGLWLPRKNVRQPPNPTSVLTTFQSGHGWTSSGSGLTVANDTVEFCIGTQSVKMTSTNTGDRSALSPDNLSLDLTGKAIEVLFKVTNTTVNDCRYIKLEATTDGTNWFACQARAAGVGAFPVDDAVGYQRFIFAQGDFAAGVTWSAVRRLRFTIAAQNTTASATVNLQRVAFVPAPAAGPIFCFTFDDSLQASRTVYLPKLAQYGFPATCYLLADRLSDTSTPITDGAGTYLTVAQARELQDGHGWQISAHGDTKAHHDNSTMSTDPGGYTTMEKSFATLKQWLLAKGFNGADDFAYGPYTTYNDPTTRDLVKKYFRSARTAITITSNAGGLANSGMPRPVAPHTIPCGMWNGSTTAQVQTLIDKCVATKGVLTLLFHDSPSGTIPVSSANFATVVDAVNTAAQANSGKVMTVGDMLDNGLW